MLAFGRCTICLCDYEEGDTLRALPCLHSYHKYRRLAISALEVECLRRWQFTHPLALTLFRDCIDHWLKSHNTCPVCKTQINM